MVILIDTNIRNMIVNKIIITANTSWNIFNFRLDLINLLKKNEYDIFVISNNDKTTNKFNNTVEFINIDLKKRNLNIFLFINNYIKIFINIYKIKPSIILTYTFKSLILFNFVSIFFPKIRIINNFTGLGSLFLNNYYKYKIIRILIYLSLIRSNDLIFQNIYDYNIFKKKSFLKNKKFYLIPSSGINLKKYKFIGINNTKKEKLNFIMIARLIKDKGVIEYMDAAKEVKKIYPELKFILIGEYDHNNNEKIEKKVLEKNIINKTIIYYPFQENIIDFIVKADCVILPSYREGTSKVLLESAAIGKPLIATDVPGCNNIVINYYNGFLCKKKSSISLKNKILEFIKLDNQQRKEMSINSRTIVENKFDSNIVNNEILSVIKNEK